MTMVYSCYSADSNSRDKFQSVNYHVSCGNVGSDGYEATENRTFTDGFGITGNGESTIFDKTMVRNFITLMKDIAERYTNP